MLYHTVIALIAVFLPETARELKRGLRRADGRGNARLHVWFEPVTASQGAGPSSVSRPSGTQPPVGITAERAARRAAWAAPV